MKNLTPLATEITEVTEKSPGLQFSVLSVTSVAVFGF
jgi:hypothetical protein